MDCTLATRLTLAAAWVVISCICAATASELITTLPRSRSARARKLQAFTPDEFRMSELYGRALFDSLLLAHVLEHLPIEAGISLIRDYLPQLKSGGQVILITPQPAGFRSDSTHVTFVDFAALAHICAQLDLSPSRQYSFPFPRPVGEFFRFNEFVVVARPHTHA